MSNSGKAVLCRVILWEFGLCSSQLGESFCISQWFRIIRPSRLSSYVLWLGTRLRPDSGLPKLAGRKEG